MEILSLFVSPVTFIKVILYGIFILFHTILVSTSVNNSTLDRLLTNFRPIHYTINLIPYIEEDNFTFDGESYIKVEAKSESNLLILHACNLQMKGTITLKNDNKEYQSNNYTINDRNDFLTIEFHKNIPRGNYTLHLKYNGLINDQLKGLYRSTYTDIFGKKQWLILTHFEPIHARQAFPCWDEPAFKATFKISIKHDRKYTALSNTRFNSISSANDSNSHVWTQFEKTPVMSSYLIAFVVGDLDYLSHSEDETFRIWTRKNSLDRGEMLLLNGFKALKLLDNFNGVSYQDFGIKKLDLVVVPDLKAIAMENWGIIILKEDEFFSAENHSSKRIRKDDFKDLTHELSHQWFGNLVTHKWWKYLWITEGLASYFSYFLNDRIEKSWRVMDKFLLDRREDVFQFDSENTVLALNDDEKLEKLWEYNRFYMNYFKSVVIIRMINSVLGEKNFKSGIRNYLINNKFGVVTSNNFFEELTKVSGDMKVTLEKALNNWESIPGYPIITINRNYTSARATITQRRFLKNCQLNSSDRYWIPMNFATEDNMDFNASLITHWFDPDSISLEILTPQSDKWLISNKQQFGYYRVNYDERNWQLIINYLKSENYQKIHHLNRAQLIDDAFTLAECRYLSYSVAFELMEYLRYETDPLPWMTFFNKMNRLHGSTSLAYSSYYKTFKKIVSTLFENFEKNVFCDKLTDEDFIDEAQKKLIIRWTCALGSTLCKDYTLSMTTKWLENPEKNPLPADLKSEILCGAIHYADENTWNLVLMKYLNDRDENILEALGCTSNILLLNNILFLAMNNVTFNVSYMWNFFSRITLESNGLEATLNFMDNYRSKIEMSDIRHEFLHIGIQMMRYNVKTNEHFSKWHEILINVIGEKNVTRHVIEIRHEVDDYNLKLESMKNYFEKRVE